MNNTQSLHFDIRVGDCISIDNGRVVITLKKKYGQVAHVHVSAERSVLIEPVRSRAADQAKKGLVALG